MSNDSYMLVNEIRAELVPVLRALTRAIEKLTERLPEPTKEEDS